MVKVDISEDGIESLRFIPAIQAGCRTDLAYGEDKDRIIAQLNGMSCDVAIDADGFVTKK